MTKISAIIVIKRFFSKLRKNFPCCWCSASSETHIHLRPTARVYELNLNWHIKIFFFYLHVIQLQTSNFQFLPLGCTVLVKMRRIAVLVVVSVILWFRRHASDKFQEVISWSITWRFFLHCLPLKYVVSDHFRWSNVPVNQINWNCVVILIKFAHGTNVWNSLSSACTSMWSLWKLFHPVKKGLKSLLRDHWPLTTIQSR